MVTVKDFEHFLDHQALISEEAEPLFGKALFNLKGEQLTACTVPLLPINRRKTVSKTQWLNWPMKKLTFTYIRQGLHRITHSDSVKKKPVT